MDKNNRIATTISAFTNFVTMICALMGVVACDGGVPFSLAGEWVGTATWEDESFPLEATIRHPSPHSTNASSISGEVRDYYDGEWYEASMSGTFTPPSTVSMTTIIDDHAARWTGTLTDTRISGTWIDDDGDTGTFELTME